MMTRSSPVSFCISYRKLLEITVLVVIHKPENTTKSTLTLQCNDDYFVMIKIFDFV